MSLKVLIPLLKKNDFNKNQNKTNKNNPPHTHQNIKTVTHMYEPKSGSSDTSKHVSSTYFLFRKKIQEQNTLLQNSIASCYESRDTEDTQLLSGVWIHKNFLQRGRLGFNPERERGTRKQPAKTHKTYFPF